MTPAQKRQLMVVHNRNFYRKHMGFRTAEALAYDRHEEMISFVEPLFHLLLRERAGIEEPERKFDA